MTATSTFFITGTSTDVGKTWVSAQLSRWFLKQHQSVIYYKPFQTGVLPGETTGDCDTVAAFNLDNKQLTCINRYCFKPPVAPLAADTEHCIELKQVYQDVKEYQAKANVVLIEGAGGLMVPITPDTLVIDIIQALNIPVILVAHCLLGTINHTLLSIDALQQRGIPISALVINNLPALNQESVDPSTLTLIDTLTPFLPKTLPIIPISYNEANVDFDALQPITAVL